MATKDVSLGSQGSVSGTLRMELTQGTQSITNNETTVNYSLKLIVSGGNWRASSGSWSISGDTSSSGNIASMTYYSGTTTLKSGSYTIKHNNAGEKTTSVSFSFSSTFLFNGSGNLSLKLTTIPRASDLSLLSAISGQESLVTIKPKNSSFANDLIAIYSNGDIQTIISKANRQTGSTSGYTVQWTPSTATAVKCTTTSTTIVTLKSTTYKSTSDDTIIGDPKEISVEVTIGRDSYSKPIIGNVTLTEANSILTSTIKTNLGISDGYLQNMSIIKATASNITTKESSTVQSGSAVFNNNGIQINGTKNGNNIEFLTSKVVSSPAVNIPTSIIVTDSRNITSDAYTSTKYKVYGYSLPIITNLNFERCNQNGTYNASGTCVKCTISGNITNINNNNNNTKQWEIYWRRKDGTWTDSNSGHTTLNNTSYVLNNNSFIVTNRTFEANTSWVFKVKSIDMINVYESQEYIVGVGSDLINIAANGKSIAFGQRSTATGNETKFECAMDAYLEENVYFRKNAYIYKGSSFINLIDFFYPIGSYYETSNTSFDPNVSWGGTWVEDSAGRFTIAKAAAGEIQQNSSTFYGTLSDAELDPTTGRVFPVGETQGEYVHKLELTEAPAHRHSLSLQVRNGGGSKGSIYGITNFTSGWDTFSRSAPATSGYLRWGMDSQGGGNAHNNLPPLVVVRRWHRTA